MVDTIISRDNRDFFIVVKVMLVTQFANKYIYIYIYIYNRKLMQTFFAKKRTFSPTILRDGGGEGECKLLFA